jgi:protein TonB
MVQLLHLGGALPLNATTAPEAEQTGGPSPDIFVDGAEGAARFNGFAGRPRFEIKPAPGAAPWRWPLLGSLAIHGVLALVLFAPFMGWNRPASGVAASQVITLVLVEMPGAGAAPAAPAPVPAAPAARPKHRAPAAPKPSGALGLQPKAKPRPLAQTVSTPDAVPEDAMTDMAPAAGKHDRAPGAGASNGSPASGGGASAGAADLLGSVPLYDLNPPPVYPAVARRREMEGTVMLSVLVDREGRAAQVRVQHGSGHAVLDRSALDCVRQWQFAPARRGGRPQEMWVQVPVRFQLR